MKTDKWFYELFLSQPGMLAELISGLDVRRPWRGLLILPSRGSNFGSESPYQDLLERWVTRLYLRDLKEKQKLSPNLTLLQLLATDQEQSTKIGKGLLQTAKTEAEFERRLSLIETILANKFPDLTTEMIMQLLDLKQTDITQSLFYQEIKQEGRQEGRQEGEVDLILRQLQRRLGVLSGQQVERVRGLSVAQWSELGEALLDFMEMAHLESHLAGLG